MVWLEPVILTLGGWGKVGWVGWVGWGLRQEIAKFEASLSYLHNEYQANQDIQTKTVPKQ